MISPWQLERQSVEIIFWSAVCSFPTHISLLPNALYNSPLTSSGPVALFFWLPSTMSHRTIERLRLTTLRVETFNLKVGEITAVTKFTISD